MTPNPTDADERRSTSPAISSGSPSGGAGPGTRESWLRAAPFTLALSGGYFGHYAHAGFLAALDACGVRPSRVVGVSSGALSGGLWAAGLPGDELVAEMVRTRRADFWDLAFPWVGLLPGRRFDALLDGLLRPLGVETHEQCAIPFAAVVCDLRMRTHVIDRGTLRTAIRASCAVPPLFRPVRHDGRWLLDGGLRDRMGEIALAPRERVLQFVLPHAPGPGGRRQVPEVARTPATPDGRRRVLCLADLPAPNPRRMELGAAAAEHARVATREWLRGTDAPPADDGGSARGP